MDSNDEPDITYKTSPKKGRRAGMSGPSGSESELVHVMDNSLSSKSRATKNVDSRPSAQSKSRRTGGWAEEVIKSGKKKNGNTNLIEQERFQSPERMKYESDDDIPVIPDLDNIPDEELALQIANAPTATINRVATYEELDTDLFKHAAFTTIDDVNLQLLAKCLCPENDIKEQDERWTWDLLFTDVASELHTDWEYEAANSISLQE